MHLYTIGYSRLPIGDFLATLKQSGVQTVLDIRLKPWSRIPAYRLPDLLRHLKSVGLGYEHVIAAGNPYRFERLIPSDWRERYRKWLLKQRYYQNESVMEWLYRQAKEQRVVLLCQCAKRVECHRGVICEELHRLDSELQIVDLGETAEQRELF